MAEGSDAGKPPISPSHHRPVPQPRKQGGSQTPPVLPAKQSVSSEREVETRLGMFRQTSFPVTSPSPLPSPPSLPERRPAPEPLPRLDEGTDEVPASLADGNGAVKTEGSLLCTSAKESKLYVNTQAENVPSDSVSTFSVASVMPSSMENELLTVSASEPAVIGQKEDLQMRSKLHHSPGSDENSNTRGYRAVSQFYMTAVEKATKSEKPPALPPGRLVVSNKLAEKIASGLNRQQTLKSVQEMENPADVGMDVTSHDSEIPAATHKPLPSVSEDSKGMLYSKVFLLLM